MPTIKISQKHYEALQHIIESELKKRLKKPNSETIRLLAKNKLGLSFDYALGVLLSGYRVTK